MGEAFQHRPDELPNEAEHAEVPGNPENVSAAHDERREYGRSIRSLKEIFEEAEAQARAEAAMNGPDGRPRSVEELMQTIRAERERRLQEKARAQRSIALMLLTDSFVRGQALRDRGKKPEERSPMTDGEVFKQYLAEKWGRNIPEDPSGVEALFRAFVENETDLHSRLSADLGAESADILCTAIREQMRLYLAIADLELSRSVLSDEAAQKQLEYALALNDLDAAERELLEAFGIRARKDARAQRLLVSKKGAQEIVEVTARIFTSAPKGQPPEVRKSEAVKRIELAAPNLPKDAQETLSRAVESGNGDIVDTVLSVGSLESAGGGAVTATIEGEKITIESAGILRPQAYLTLPDGKRIPLPLEDDFVTEFDRARGNAVERRAQISFLANASDGSRDGLMKSLGSIDTKDSAFMDTREAEAWKLRLRAILHGKGDASDERAALRSLGILRDNGTTDGLRAAWFRTYFRVLEGRSGMAGLEAVRLSDLQSLAEQWNRNGKISLPTMEDLRRNVV